MGRRGEFLKIWEKPVTVKDLVGAVVTIIIGAGLVVFVAVALSSGGQKAIVDRIDHNAQIGVAQAKALRCVLKLRPDPERSFKRTQYLINACYTEFDKLIKEEADA